MVEHGWPSPWLWFGNACSTLVKIFIKCRKIDKTQSCAIIVVICPEQHLLDSGTLWVNQIHVGNTPKPWTGTVMDRFTTKDKIGEPTDSLGILPMVLYPPVTKSYTIATIPDVVVWITYGWAPCRTMLGIWCSKAGTGTKSQEGGLSGHTSGGGAGKPNANFLLNAKKIVCKTPGWHISKMC